MAESFPVLLLRFATTSGKCPFDLWFRALSEPRTKAIVAVRLNRLIQGNFGLCRNLGRGLWELKIDFGPGLRVYFGRPNLTTVVLLLGGEKRNQTDDIERARRLWAEYEKRTSV